MGVLIFTHDAQKYRVGDFVEGAEVLCSPNVKGLTVIVHKRKPTAKECLAWLPYIAHRMVWVCEVSPKIKDDAVIDETKSPKKDYVKSIDATIRWNDRRKAHLECAKVPTPLMLAFLRENNNDIDLWRLLTQSFTNVPDSFQKALIAFAHKPKRRMNYPKRKNKDEEVSKPFGIRDSDIYWEDIVRIDIQAANEIRGVAKECLPKGVKETAQAENEGWL